MVHWAHFAYYVHMDVHIYIYTSIYTYVYIYIYILCVYIQITNICIICIVQPIPRSFIAQAVFFFRVFRPSGFSSDILSFSCFFFVSSHPCCDMKVVRGKQDRMMRFTAMLMYLGLLVGLSHGEKIPTLIPWGKQWDHMGNMDKYGRIWFLIIKQQNGCRRMQGSVWIATLIYGKSWKRGVTSADPCGINVRGPLGEGERLNYKKTGQSDGQQTPKKHNRTSSSSSSSRLIKVCRSQQYNAFDVFPFLSPYEYMIRICMQWY